MFSRSWLHELSSAAAGKILIPTRKGPLTMIAAIPSHTLLKLDVGDLGDQL
jgi:hypothetical protein